MLAFEGVDGRRRKRALMYRSLTCAHTHIAEREIEVLLPHNSGFVCIGGEGWEMNVCITLKKKKGRPLKAFFCLNGHIKTHLPRLLLWGQQPETQNPAPAQPLKSLFLS